MASMIFIKTMVKMNEFVEHYDTLFVTQNGIYSDSGKTTRSENMILSQLKMGEHQSKYGALIADLNNTLLKMQTFSAKPKMWSPDC